MFYILFIPGFIEELYRVFNNNGNMALCGVCLDLYNKRNLFYISLFVFLVCYIYKFYYHILLFFVFLFFILFANSYYKWKQVLQMYLR